MESSTIVIGLPVHNGGKHFAEALDSLLGQTWKDFRVVVIDDGSTDGTGEIIHRCQREDRRIHCVRLPQRSGLVAAWRMAAEKAGYHAVIIPCGGDPGIAPLREVLTIPVVPPGSAAKHICSLLGPRFSIVTTGKGTVKRTEIHERDGLMKLVSVHPVGLTVPEVRVKPQEAYEAMAREGKRAVEEYGACSVTYGCMSMGFLMVDEKLSAEIGVPVVNPVKAAVAELAPVLQGKGLVYRSPIVRMRQMFDLYICLRPCKAYPGNPLNYRDDIDLIVFRENTEDLYSGVEFSPVPPDLGAIHPPWKKN